MFTHNFIPFSTTHHLRISASPSTPEKKTVKKIKMKSVLQSFSVELQEKLSSPGIFQDIKSRKELCSRAIFLIHSSVSPCSFALRANKKRRRKEKFVKFKVILEFFRSLLKVKIS
jgi:hypothetical protein